MNRLSVLSVFIISAILFASCTSSEQTAGNSVASGPGTPSFGGVEQILTQAERDKAVAFSSGRERQMAWIDQWLADDMIFTNADGQVSTGTKKSALDDLASGAWEIETATIEDIRVRVYGDSAVVTALQREQSRRQGKDSGGNYQYTHVWFKKDGRWQVVAAHTTHLK